MMMITLHWTIFSTNFLSGGVEKCSYQPRPSGFKIFEGKYNSF